MNKIAAVLFDVDGTLLDSTEFIYQAFVHTLHFHHLPSRSFTEILHIMGKPLDEMYRHFSESTDVAYLCETHRQFQAENLHLSVPFAHTRETLQRLQQAGLKIAAVTTRSKRTSIKTLEQGGIAGYFDVIISGEDAPHLKPHPEPLLQALRRLEVAPAYAVMVGDTEADMLAARRAGVRTIGVSYGLHGSLIAASHPDFIVNDILDVLSILLSPLN